MTEETYYRMDGASAGRKTLIFPPLYFNAPADRGPLRIMGIGASARDQKTTTMGLSDGQKVSR